MGDASEKRNKDVRSVSFGSRLAPFVNNLIVRLSIGALLGLLIGGCAGDFFSDLAVPSMTQALAQQIASDIRVGEPEIHMLEAFRRHGAAFCYITSDRTLRITNETEVLAGNFKIVRPRTGKFVVDDRAYYHVMEVLSGDRTLHVGMAYGTGTSLPQLLRHPMLFLTSRSDNLHLISEILGVFVATCLVCYYSIIRPAALMANLPFGEDKARAKQLKVATFGASYELMHLYKSLMAYSRSARAPRSNTSDFQRPLEMRIDDALMAKSAQIETAQNITALKGIDTKGPYRSLEVTLAGCTNLKEFRDELMNGLSHTEFKYCVLLQQGGDSAVAATSYIDHRSLQLLSKIDHAVILKLITETNKTMDIGAMSLRRYGFGMLSEYMNLKNVRYSPIKHQGTLIAALIIFFDTQMSEFSPDALVDLESFCSRIGGLMSLQLKKQELEEAGLKDQLTGLPNRKFLQDYLSERLHLAAKELYRDPLSLLIVQPNISDAVISQHGDAVRDKILQEVGAAMQKCLKAHLESKINWQLVRYDTEEFAVCAQPLNESSALELGVALQAEIIKSKTSIGDMFGVTLTVGSATSPGDARDERALLSRAKLAMRFAEEFKVDTRIASAREVPVTYEPSKRLADISGELGVLDCAALLQSIANSQKTGILAVEDEVGRQYQSLFKAGKLLSSSLEEFHNMDAVIEFVTSFEAGRYNFRLVSDTELDKLASAVTAPHMSLDKCLMEAAMAEDHLKKARKNLRETHLMRATPGEAARQQWLKIENDTRTYNSIERHTMQRILALADGSRTLEHIFVELQFAPTYLKWHAAAILTDNRLLQSKKVS